MSGLFSHPSAAADVPGPRPDLRAAISVPAPLDHAWAGLMEHLHLWWPADGLSRWGADSFFDLEDNALVETSADDDENVWGEVTDTRPGEWLELQWRHVGSASTTLVRLAMDGEGSTPPPPDAAASTGSGEGRTDGVRAGTTLTVVHTGWSAADPQDLYDFYQAFWPLALSRYQRFMGGS